MAPYLRSARCLIRRFSGMAFFLTLGSLTGTAVHAQGYQFQYDPNGNMTQITDPLGRVTNQSFDPLNRLKQQLQPSPTAGVARPTISYGYNGQNQLTSVTDPRNLVTGYTVNGLGNQTALSSPDTGAAAQTFDEVGNMTSRTDARGKTTRSPMTC